MGYQSQKPTINLSQSHPPTAQLGGRAFVVPSQNTAEDEKTATEPRSPSQVDLLKINPFAGTNSSPPVQPKLETPATPEETAEDPVETLQARSQDSPPPTTPQANLPPIQPKLTIGPPQDQYEQEADRVAAQVMRMPDPVVPPSHQRSVEPANHPEHQPLQTQPLQTQPIAADITPLVQRQPQAKGAETAAIGLEQQLSHSRSGGQALSEEVRSFMEPRFGADFSGVRVHTDAESVQMNQAIGAQAFTHGNHVYYGAGKAPGNNELTAHELTHVVQQTTQHPTQTRSPGQLSPQIQRNCSSSSDCLTNLDRHRSNLRLLIQVALHSSLTDPTSLGDELVSAGLQVLPDEAIGELEQRAQAVAEVQVPPADTGTTDSGATDSGITVAIALRNLKTLLETNLPPQAQGTRPAYSLNYLIRGIATDITNYFLGALTGAPPEVTTTADSAWSHLYDDLERVIAATEDPIALLEVELEATLQELMSRRLEFASVDSEAGEAAAQEERAALGQEIGRLARSVLLLNQSLMQLQTTGTSRTTPLDQAVTRAAGEIAHIRTVAAQEEATRSALGDRVTLLADQDIALTNPVFEHQGISDTSRVFAEEALPQTMDDASIEFMGELSQRVTDQSTQVSRIREAVIPANPRYDLVEFGSLFRRWFAFVSPAQEQQDPIYRLAIQLMGEPYRLAGIDTGSPFGGLQSGIGRAFLMNTAAQMLTHGMGGGVSTEFSTQLDRHRLRRVQPDVTGTASEPNYDYAELYPARGSVSIDAQGETQSRTTLAQQQQQTTATRFSQVAQRPAAEQPTAAREAGIVPASEPLVPLVGLRTTEAQEGWSYLITVIDPMDPDQQPIAREHRVMPPEVVHYLLAQQQQRVTLEQPHQPQAERRSLGEGSVERSSATSVARYVRGEASPQPDRAAVDLQHRLAAASTQAGINPDDRSTSSDQIVATLVGDLHSYLDQFFVQHQTAEYHLAAVFTIANIEHGVGEQIMQLISPESMAQIMGEALKISLEMAALQSLGPLGQLAAAGYRAYLNTQGIGEVSALIGIATFLRNASQAESLSAARAWAVLSRNFADDLGELFESLLGMPVETSVSHAMERLTRERPNTPTELAELCRPMMQHPEARQALLEGVIARLGELEATGVGSSRSDPEYDALVAFRQELEGVSLPQAGETTLAAGAATLPGREAETAATQFFAAGRIRTAEERAALAAAVPADLQGLPIIENPTLTGHTVRVVYLHGNLRMEVGPTAEPSHVQAHAETARQLRRYQGVLGFIRRLRDRIFSWLRIQPGYGDQGFEARLEVQKLTAIQADLSARQAALEQRMAALGTADAHHLQTQAEAIAQELASIQEQLEEHAAEIDSYTSGRGFVAAEARPRRVIERSHIQEPTLPTLRPGDRSWDLTLTANIDGEIVIWGLVSVPLDRQGNPAGPPSMSLDTRTQVGGQNVILDLPGDLSFTRIALEQTNAAYRNTFGREPENLGGGLADRNLLNFQRQFVRIRGANPTWNSAQIAQEALRQVSFGQHRTAIGYSDFRITLGSEVELALLDEAGNPMGTHAVPSSVNVVASRPPDQLDPAGRLERDSSPETFRTSEFVGDTNLAGEPEARYYASSSLENGIMTMDFVLRRGDLPGQSETHRSSQLRGRAEFEAALAHFRRIHGHSGVRGVQGQWGGGDNLDRFNAEFRRLLREGVDQPTALRRAAFATHTGGWARDAGFTQVTIDAFTIDPNTGNCTQVTATFTGH
ncbi:MAG: DUF4157 domain-containing protein [Synechococcales bacterium]|nr:DUF4157 domain-containing protein [Synechococcales bacterium]